MNKIEFYKETNFKQTPIGKIPKDWQIQKLGDVITFIKGKKPKEMTEQYEEGYLPYLSAEYLRENKATNFVKPSNDVTLVNDGDLILLWDGSNAGEFFYGKHGVLSSTMVKIEQQEQLFDRKFLFCALKMKEDFLRGQTKGTGIPHVDENVLKNIILPNPSLLEQRSIADVLSVVDLAIQRTDLVIAKTERLKKGLMQTLLTRGIGHKEFKDTEIGKIPKTWRVATLGEIAKINKEQIDPTKSMPDKTFIYIDIDSVENETGKIRNPKKILGRNAPSRARRVVHENDVIMSTVRPYLKAFAIIPKEYDDQICSTGFAVLSCKKDIVIPYFLLIALFSENVIKQCNQMMMGGQYPALNQSQVSRIKIPLPSCDEQEKIASIFYALDEKLELERIEKKRLEMIKKGLMDLLLTGKVRVKVN